VGGYREHFTPEQLHKLDALLAEADLRSFGYGTSQPAEAIER
jgi:hypothetical protein